MAERTPREKHGGETSVVVTLRRDEFLTRSVRTTFLGSAGLIDSGVARYLDCLILMRMIRRLTRICSAAARPSVVVFAILSLLVGTIGFPVVRRNVADAENPYPCQEHACGCTSAAACWDHCCCFTPVEKLAWAEARGVTPPATFLEKHGAATLVASAKCGSSCGSCAKHSANHEPAGKPAQRGKTKIEFTVGELARHCQGQPPVWTLLNSAVPVARLEFVIVCEPAAWVRVVSVSADSIELDRSVPPPRNGLL